MRPTPLTAAPGHTISPRSHAFRQAFFPTANDSEWNDWHWQLQNSIRNLKDLNRVFSLSDDERTAVERHTGSLPVGITPYYASLLGSDPQDGLRRTMIMVNDEYRRAPEESVDPLGEDSHSPVPGIVHRYPDRVLFLVTGACAVYCRYCTRSRMVGDPGGEYQFNTKQWQAAIDYIARTPAVRDVLLSGGDPLLLSDERLEWLLEQLSRIPHVEFLRIGSKIPFVLPQRITSSLVEMLRKYHPLWMSVHANHPAEITPESSEACGSLADAGIPLGSQTVLLRGVNDDLEVMRQLFHGLLRIRVKPYYLFQADLVVGTSHFRTPLAQGLEIMRGLRGFTSGYAVPQFAVDLPGGGGKTPFLPEYYLGSEEGASIVRNYEGKIYRLPLGEGG